MCFARLKTGYRFNAFQDVKEASFFITKGHGTTLVDQRLRVACYTYA